MFLSSSLCWWPDEPADSPSSPRPSTPSAGRRTALASEHRVSPLSLSRARVHCLLTRSFYIYNIYVSASRRRPVFCFVLFVCAVRGRFLLSTDFGVEPVPLSRRLQLKLNLIWFWKLYPTQRINMDSFRRRENDPIKGFYIQIERIAALFVFECVRFFRVGKTRLTCTFSRSRANGRRRERCGSSVAGRSNAFRSLDASSVILFGMRGAEHARRPRQRRRKDATARDGADRADSRHGGWSDDKLCRNNQSEQLMYGFQIS